MRQGNKQSVAPTSCFRRLLSSVHEREPRPSGDRGAKGAHARRSIAIALALALFGMSAKTADAQSSALDTLPGPPSPGAVGEQVAASLYNRGMALFELGDVATAKTLFVESLERSPDGSRAADALGMLRTCNEKLGIQNLEAGRPTAGGNTSEPIDPYANSGDQEAGDKPLDPYAGQEGPVDPYGAEEPPKEEPTPEPKPDAPKGHATTTAMVAGGLTGFIAGMAMIGPFEVREDGSLGDLSGGAVPLGLLASAGGIYLGKYLGEKYDRPRAQALSYGALWGMYNFGHLSNVFVGEDSDGNDIYRGMALGALVGGGLGYVYDKKLDPTEGEIAVLNGGSLLGTTTGLMLAAAIDPPRGDAYSLNMTLGSMAGLGAGIYFRDAFEGVSARRTTYVTGGALAGALAPWILVYPFLGDDDPHQVTGFLSALSLAGGAYLTWKLTDEMDGDGDKDAPEPTSAPALVQRSVNGDWRMSAPLPRSVQNPALAPPTGFSLGADILSGSF